MPGKPAFSASVGEWRTVLTALQHYQKYLDATLPQSFETDEDFILYDDFERLERIIPNFERQLTEYLSDIPADQAA